MKFIKLHSKNTSIVYKNSLCSSAGAIVYIFLIASILLPLLLVSFLSQYAWIDEEHQIIFEQPKMKFKFQYIFMAEATFEGDENGKLIACSTFPYLNKFEELKPVMCTRIKVLNPQSKDR